MQSKSDAQLLREYAEQGIETAFNELVTRHTNLVYSAAMRQVGSLDAATEITQTVFIGLARAAHTLIPRLASDASLAGWLCRSAHNISKNRQRDDFRRHSRERLAMEQIDTTAPELQPDWKRLAPILDEAMSELRDSDYEALVLRYFKNQDLRSIGAVLGVSDDTAQKRVARALEKLRELLARRGVTTTATALSMALLVNAVQAAPANLAIAISNAVALAPAATAISTPTAIKAIAMTTLQKTLITSLLIATVGAGIYQTQQVSKLRSLVDASEKQQASLKAQMQQLERERNASANRLALIIDEMGRNNNSTELLRLRGEVGRLRSDSKELARLKADGNLDSSDPLSSASKELVAQVNLLKRRLDQKPETKIPELQLLTGQDWLHLVQDARLRQENPSDEQILWALETIRSNAKQHFAYELQPALLAYSNANNGQLPNDPSVLAPYFRSPVDETALQRYQMLKTGNVNDLQPGELVIGEKAPVDDQYDTLWQIGLTNFVWRGTGNDNRSFGKGGWPAH